MTAAAQLLAAAAAVALVGAATDKPRQIHVAYAGATPGTSVVVSWQTVNVQGSEVRYGASPDDLSGTATGSCSTYYATYDHHVVLEGLTPKTQYFYVCGDAAIGFSNVFNFTTAAAYGQEFPLNVAVFGDMGIYNNGQTLADLARVAPSLDFILHIGDISYADDDFLKETFADKYEYTWNLFMNTIQPYASHLPYMVLPGNHEAECHSPVCLTNQAKRKAFANYTAYNHRFRMPSTSSGGVLNMWYSFDVGSVHFVALDTETDYANSPDNDYASVNGYFGNQLAWLEADLQRAASRRAAGQVSWIVAGGHRPMYTRAATSVGGNPTSYAQYVQVAFEPLFHAYGVDVYFAGHEHSVEATWPVYANDVETDYRDPTYTVHVVTGAGGCEEGHTSYASDPTPTWSRFSNDVNYGLSVLTIHNESALSWTFRRGSDGKVLDTMTILRSQTTFSQAPSPTITRSPPVPSLSRTASRSTSATRSSSGTPAASTSPSTSASATASRTISSTPSVSLTPSASSSISVVPTVTTSSTPSQSALASIPPSQASTTPSGVLSPGSTGPVSWTPSATPVTATPTSASPSSSLVATTGMSTPAMPTSASASESASASGSNSSKPQSSADDSAPVLDVSGGATPSLTSGVSFPALLVCAYTFQRLLRGNSVT